MFILRDPLVRLYSNYNMRIKHASLASSRVYNKKIPSFWDIIKPDIVALRECGMEINVGDTNFNPRDIYNENVMWCFHDDKFKIQGYHFAKGMYSWQLEMLRRSANPNRIMVVCYDDFHAENIGFVEMVAKFLGLDTNEIGKARKLLPSHKTEVECPTEYRKNHSLVEITDYFEEWLHAYYEKWNNVLREDFGIDCGWRRKLPC